MNSLTTEYTQHMLIKDAIAVFFEKNNFGADGGAGQNWAKLKFGRFYVPFPNTAARKKTVIYHDVHHIIAGYPTSWAGEIAIGAWEVSSGCGDYPVAWVLDLSVFAMGLFLFPRSIFRAFVRGRRTLNFYHHTYTYPQILDMTIAEAQAILKLDTASDQNATTAETIQFIGWWFIATIISLMIFVAPIAIPLIYLLIR